MINNFFQKYYEAIAVSLIALFVFLLAWLCSGCAVKPGPVPSLPAIPSLTTIIYKTNWLMSASIITIGLGAFVFFSGNQRGLKIIASALVVIVAVLTITKYALWFAVVGLVATIGIFAYNIYSQRREKLNLGTALKEIIFSVERFKNNNIQVPDEVITYLKDVFSVEQSDSTKAIVEKIKNGSAK